MDALGSAGPVQGTIAVLGQVRIGKAIEEHGHPVLLVANKPRGLRHANGAQVYSELDALPLTEHRLGGLVVFGIGQREDWGKVLKEWNRAVTQGGVVVLVDRVPPAELTRRALCSGLTDIEQRQTGRTIITSGRVMLS